jgi:hypothetical protein
VNTENHTSTAPETINGAYISSPVQHNNILRSHQIILASEEKEKTTTEVMEVSIAEVEERLRVKVEETVGKVGEGEKDVNTENHMLTVPETINGAYIVSPVQHNNILRSHQFFFTEPFEEGNCDYYEDKIADENELSCYEALHLFANSPAPPNYQEQMIEPGSGFTFVAKRISESSGEPFRHFLDLSIPKDKKIAETYRCICGEGSDFLKEEGLTGDGPDMVPDMVVFNFADEMIPVAVQMWISNLSTDQNLPIDSCVKIVCQR